jgi:hypothetical protein
LFRFNTDKKPEPGSVKKIFLLLLAAKIMKYSTTRETKDNGKTVVHVYGALAFDSADASKLALNVDKYWTKVKCKAP